MYMYSLVVLSDVVDSAGDESDSGCDVEKTESFNINSNHEIDDIPVSIVMTAALVFVLLCAFLAGVSEFLNDQFILGSSRESMRDIIVECACCNIW